MRSEQPWPTIKATIATLAASIKMFHQENQRGKLDGNGNAIDAHQPHTFVTLRTRLAGCCCAYMVITQLRSSHAIQEGTDALR